LALTSVFEMEPYSISLSVLVTWCFYITLHLPTTEHYVRRNLQFHFNRYLKLRLFLTVACDNVKILNFFFLSDV
jgi:hypothetical protein